MGSQTYDGKKLLELIKVEFTKAVALTKRATKLLEEVENHNKAISKLVTKLSEEDQQLYAEQLKKLETLGEKHEKELRKKVIG